MINAILGAYGLAKNPELLGPMAINLGKGLGKSTYNRVSGRDFDSDLGSVSSAWDYTKQLSEDPSIAGRDARSYFWKKLLGSNPVENNLEELVRSVLSGDFEKSASVKTLGQEALMKKSGGKYSGKRIFGLYSEDDDTVYLDSGLDEGMKYRTLLHEALERSSGRDDHSNDEQEHVGIELQVAKGLEYASKNFTGALKERAEKAKDAFYKSVREGASAGDDLFTKVNSSLSRN